MARTQHNFADEPVDETVKNVGRVMQGSIVTFSEGLGISNLATAFELCSLCIDNLPSDVQDAELLALFTDRELLVDRFHLIGIKKNVKGMLRARLIADKQSAQTLSSGVLKIRDSTLTVEMSTDRVLEGVAPCGATTLAVLHRLSTKCSGKAPCTTIDADQICPICCDSISDPFQLDCGHTYCSACLRHFLDSAANVNQFPLTCVADDGGCQAALAISIIHKLLAPASFERLLKAAFDFYVSKRPTEFKFCRTPDCSQIYRSTSKNVAATLCCPSCSKDFCSACADEAHDGSCDKLERRKDEEERLTSGWIATQGERIKECPQCKALVEKDGGCNRVGCRLVSRPDLLHGTDETTVAASRSAGNAWELSPFILYTHTCSKCIRAIISPCLTTSCWTNRNG